MRYVLKDLLVDTEARTVQLGDRVVRLPDLSFDALVKLLEASPEPVDIADFARSVWRADHVSDETVAQRIALLRKALCDDPKNPAYVRTVRGQGYATVGSAEKTDATTDQAPAGFMPRHRAAFALVGLVLALFAIISTVATHDPEPKATEPVATIEPKSATAILVQRARQQLSLHQARETDRAIVMLREALAQEPDNFGARLSLSFALSTKTTKFGGGEREEQESETIARSLIAERPDSSNAWSALAYALGSQGRLDESLSAYQYAYQIDPNNTAAISSAAHTQLIQGNLHQALLLEARAKQAGGTSRYSEIQVAQMLELINHPAATDWYTKALSLNPGQIVVLSEVARSHLRHGTPETALEILDQATGDDRFAPQILQLRGRAALMLGNMQEAKKLFEAAGASGHKDLAALTALSGKTPEPKDLFHPATLADLEADTWAGSHVHLAEIAAALGHPAEVGRHLAQAINLGWRDIRWLRQSPFLSQFMTSNEGREIESRIDREIDLQRRLIEGTDDLTSFINSYNG